MTRAAADLETGQSGRVVRVAGTDDIGRRLLEMGVTPGVEIRRLGTAPLGDPLEFELRGYRLSLRKSEANHVQLENHEFLKAIFELRRHGAKSTNAKCKISNAKCKMVRHPIFHFSFLHFPISSL